METWSLMVQNNIASCNTCFLLTVKALSQCGYLKEALDLVNNLEEPSVMNPPLPVYNILLKECVGRKSLGYANEFLRMMEHQAVGKNETTYRLLLKHAELQNDLSAVHRIWKECNHKYNPSIMMLRSFIVASTKLKDLNLAIEVLQQMVSVAFQQNLPFVVDRDGNWHHSRLDIPIPRLNVPSEYHKKPVESEMFKYHKKPVEPAMTLLGLSFGDVLNTCSCIGNLVLAKQLFSQVQTFGLDSGYTYDGYIRTLLRVSGFRDGLEMLKVMQQKNIEPLHSTIAAISASCSRALEIDLAENLLDQITNVPFAYSYNAFFEACSKLDKPERALRVLRLMKQRKTKLDVMTYGILLKLFGNVNGLYEEGTLSSQAAVAKRIKAIENDMIKNGIEHNEYTMLHMVKAFGQEGMMKEVKEQLINGDTRVFSIFFYEAVLHSFVKAEEYDIVIEVFKNMVSHGFELSASIYTTMIRCYGYTKCYKSVSAVVSMMIRSGYPLNTVTYTVLIQVMLKFEDMEEVLMLLDRSISEGMQPDLVTYYEILKAADYKGRIDVIELVVEYMHQNKVCPDAGICRHVIQPYIYGKFHSIGMEAIQSMSMRMISDCDETLKEAELKYNDLIYDEDIDFESQIFQIFEESQDLASALLFLRWCAILGYELSWSTNENFWAKHTSLPHASELSDLRTKMISKCIEENE